MRSNHSAISLCALPLLLAPSALGMQLEQTEQETLQQPSPQSLDQFGSAVDMDASWLLAGAPASPTTGPGAVFAYLDSGSGYALQQAIPAPGGASSFGKGVAVKGSVAAVAAYANVYVYQEVAGPMWSLDQALPPSTGNAASYATALAVDGNTIAVGQFGLSDERVYVWVENAGTWSIQQILTGGGGPGSGFGLACALSGNTLVVGARDDDQSVLDGGAVHVFTRSGTVWTQQVKLVGTGLSAGLRFGTAVDLDDLGGGMLELAVGARGSNSGFGRAYVFRGAGASWTQTAQLLPASGGAGAWFGRNVAIEDGWLTVGSPFGDLALTDAGQATVYRRCGASWVRQVDLLASDAAVNDGLGRALASTNGLVAAGAPSADTTFDEEGAVYLYELGAGGPSSYCQGDGSGTACPCANEDVAGSPGGCVNSSGAGAFLVLDDNVSVGTDKLRAYACGMLPNQPALLFAGTTTVNGGAGSQFGDGLRCAGTNVVRLGVITPDANGNAIWGPGLQALGGWSAGDTRFFQVWYRDPVGGPCASGFNLTNAVEQTFVP